jgi:uncharacterized RDD family membrane protein YckC
MPPPPAWQPPVGPTSVTGLGYAGWWQRVGGSLIDGVVLYVINVIINVAFRNENALRVHWTFNNGDQVTYLTFSFLALLVSTFVGFIYVWLQLGASGRTLGMLAVGVRAVRADDGKPIGFGRAAGRTVVEFVLQWTAIGGLLSYLWPLWDPRKQTLQDKAAGTVVVKSRG